MLPHECWTHDAERGRVVSEGGAVIARVNTKGQDPTRAPYAHQDARLIASAPEVLRHAIALADDHDRLCRRADGCPACEHMQQIRGIAREIEHGVPRGGGARPGVSSSPR